MHTGECMRTPRSILLCLLLVPSAVLADAPPDLRPDMHRLLGSLRALLPLVSEDAVLEDPARREELGDALRELAAGARQLEAHTQHLGDPAARRTGQALVLDVARALRHLEAGNAHAAGYGVRQLTQHCAACHTRGPDEKPRPVALELARSEQVAALPPLARTRVLMATRRFDEALELLEEQLASDRLVPADLVGPLTDYIVICVRVRRDPLRAVPALERFAQRDDLWLQLRRDARYWAGALRELAAREPGADRIASAAALIDEGRTQISFPSDRRALVHYVFASRELHEQVERGGTPLELARAYQLLGLVESRIGRSFWSSDAAWYLEAAVRAAPGSAAARDAYAVLEEETLVGFTGSAGLRLPGDVRAHLDGLRELIETGAGDAGHRR